MARLHVDSSDVDLDVAEGETIIAAAWRANFFWPTSCGGVGTCLRCWTRVEAGAENLSPISDFEQRGLDILIDTVIHEGRPIRLACQTYVHGDATVRKTGVRAVQTHPFS